MWSCHRSPRRRRRRGRRSTAAPPQLRKAARISAAAPAPGSGRHRPATAAASSEALSIFPCRTATHASETANRIVSSSGRRHTARWVEPTVSASAGVPRWGAAAKPRRARSARPGSASISATNAPISAPVPPRRWPSRGTATNYHRMPAGTLYRDFTPADRARRADHTRRQEKVGLPSDGRVRLVSKRRQPDWGMGEHHETRFFDYVRTAEGR